MTGIKIQTTIREQVYNILKERIINGYYPGGTHLSEQQICDELNISRSPVREAIRLLETDNLLDVAANKGVTVHTFTEKDVRDLYQAEALVQNGSIRFGFNYLDPDLKDRFWKIRQDFIDAYHSKDHIQYLDVSARFHEMISELSGNNLIIQFYRRNSMLSRRFRVIALQDPQRMAASHKEHLRMIDAIMADDRETLLTVMSYHISEAARITLLAIPKESDIE